MTTPKTITCLCGKPATQTAYLPINVWVGAEQMKDAHWVCDYHAEKARALGQEVVNRICMKSHR